MKGVIYARYSSDNQREEVLTDWFVSAWLMRRKTGFGLLKRILTGQ